MLKEVGKTYHVCPTYNGGRDWPQGAYNPRSNVMFMPLSNLCIDSTARTDREAAAGVRLQHDERRQVRRGKDKVGRIDAISVETGRTLWSWETRVSNYSPILATAAASSSTARWTVTCARSMPTRARSCGRRGWRRRWSAHRSRSRSMAGEYIAITAGGGPIAGTQLAPTPEADTASGANASMSSHCPARQKRVSQGGSKVKSSRDSI